MKKHIIILITCVFCLVFCSCSNELLKSSIENNDAFCSANENSSYAFFPVKTFSKYETFNSNSFDSDFDKEMLQNPIDFNLNTELNTLYSSGTREYQVLLSKYIELWIDEMNYSVSNINLYLSKEQIENFEKTQIEWEESLSQDIMFDQSLISDKGINLGTQYVQSSLINGIEQYRKRVFYIKYLTMLCENYTVVEVPEDEQLWNSWSIEQLE